jgi:hypothetical protein
LWRDRHTLNRGVGRLSTHANEPFAARRNQNAPADPAREKPRSDPEARSNQMRKLLTFAFGVVVGMMAATAWAQFVTKSAVGAPAAEPAAISPLDMMWNVGPLPVHPDADSV